MKKQTMVFALTGNMGTGKSTVAWMFEELGVPVLDSDEIGHEALAPKSPAWKMVYERFGNRVLLSGGEIDRKKLAAIVFENPQDRKFLESAVHPHVKEQIEHRVAKLAKTGNPFVIVEVPLLFEAGWEKEFDAVIVVKCDEEEEIKRCISKFDFTRDEVKKRLAAQYPLSRKIAAADAIIDNGGSIKETKVEVHRLYQEMVKGKFTSTERYE